MARIRVLSDEALAELADAYEQWRRTPTATVNRPPSADEEGQAPDELLAITTEAIAGAEECDSGLSSGAAEVYRILEDGTLEAVDGFEVEVWNPDADAVAASTLILCSRDRFGSWLVAEVYGECSAGTATATSTADDDEALWYAATPPSGEQSGGAWYSGEP
ncbi:MAG TPA: hypothetical protein VD932_02680 [Aquabacterium sp.]|nr:hypothetical protein [Aquabacterium sp.]